MHLSLGRLHVSAAVFPILTAATLSCSSPSGPIAIHSPWGQFNAKIENVNGAPTLIQFQCFLDGQRLTVLADSGVARSAVEFGGVLTNAKHGAHTLEIRIVNQVSSPTAYTVSGLTIKLWVATGWDTGYSDGSVTLPSVTQTLSTGQSFVFPYSI